MGLSNLAQQGIALGLFIAVAIVVIKLMIKNAGKKPSKKMLLGYTCILIVLVALMFVPIEDVVNFPIKALKFPFDIIKLLANY
jgi:hypothetical protein